MNNFDRNDLQNFTKLYNEISLEIKKFKNINKSRCNKIIIDSSRWDLLSKMVSISYYPETIKTFKDNSGNLACYFAEIPILINPHCENCMVVE